MTRSGGGPAAVTRPGGAGGAGRPDGAATQAAKEVEKGGKKEKEGAALVALDEDALAGALFGGLDDGVFEVPGDRRHTG